jgi:hypothetical protein
LSLKQLQDAAFMSDWTIQRMNEPIPAKKERKARTPKVTV